MHGSSSINDNDTSLLVKSAGNCRTKETESGVSGGDRHHPVDRLLTICGEDMGQCGNLERL